MKNKRKIVLIFYQDRAAFAEHILRAARDEGVSERGCARYDHNDHELRSVRSVEHRGSMAR
jgi:hypothetical protein